MMMTSFNDSEEQKTRQIDSLIHWLQTQLPDYEEDICSVVVYLKGLGLTSLGALKSNSDRVLKLLPYSPLSPGLQDLLEARIQSLAHLSILFGAVRATRSRRKIMSRFRYVDPVTSQALNFSFSKFIFKPLDLSPVHLITVSPIYNQEEDRWVFPIPYASEEWCRAVRNYRRENSITGKVKITVEIILEMMDCPQRRYGTIQFNFPYEPEVVSQQDELVGFFQ